MLGVMDEIEKERCKDINKEEKRRVKRYIYQSKKEVNEQFGEMMNYDANGIVKFFLKEVGNVNGGKVANCIRIKEKSGKLAVGEEDV